jgi:hypothetical protein
MKEYFRGVIWPRKPTKNQTTSNYRYIIVGMVVTDKPIEEFNGNEFLLDGPVHGFGITNSLKGVEQKQPAFKIGTADQVLLMLDCIVKEDV